MQRIVSDAYLYQRILLQQTIELTDILAAVQRPRDAGEAPFVVTKAQLQRWLTHEGVAFSQAWR